MVGSERDPVQVEPTARALANANAGTQSLMSRGSGAGLAVDNVQEDPFRTYWKRPDQNRMASLLADAARIAGSDGPVEDRLVAIRLLGLADKKTARGLFPSLLDARQPIAVQLGVLQALAALLDGEVARQIAMQWRSMSPTVRREGAEVLFSRREGVMP